MKPLIRWRIALPYIILILILGIVLALTVPLLLPGILRRAAETGTPPNFVSLYWVIAIISFLGAGLAVVFSIYVTRNTIAPIKRLALAATRMGEGKFEEVVIPKAPAEIRELSDTLRQTADRLGEQIGDLTRERATLSAVLSQMTDGVLIADQGGKVQLLNRAAERLFHIKEKNAMGRSIVEVMRHHQLVDLWSETRQGDPKTITLEIGSDHKFLQVIGIPLGADLPGSIMILLQDLTMVHRMDMIRRDFISNVSHELRTPLASLKALTETLLDGALDDPPAARRFIVRMDTEVDNLTLLVNELLELSRIESGKISFDFQRISPCKLLTSPCERMSLQADRVGLSLDLQCPGDLPPVFADRDRIGQVVINLLHNAIKNTPPGGRIVVTASQQKEMVVFSVQDTGVGIEQKDIDRIFERFYKADRARTGGGTGLGLSISKHMVEAHGGQIWVESQEGLGSTFFFSLPVA
jgi:two-component system phosphate regulon sensor histidine kinase PhoR